MTFTSIVTHLDPAMAIEAAAAAAISLALAGAFSVHVTALIFLMDSALTAPTPANYATKQLEDRAVAAFAAIAQRRDVAYQTKSASAWPMAMAKPSLTICA
ncbi:MAG: hypothetical protein FJX33_15455 [Alphaproteobacteria bacterium]|nr:hypothetical protein [Alphaproteobacteria bacterium]